MTARKHKDPFLSHIRYSFFNSVKGGTYYPITVKKHIRAQAIAQENSKTCQLHINIHLKGEYHRTAVHLLS